MNTRGIIQNVARAQQINDFSGLCIGKITPTDIDGVIEYQDKAYVFIEMKYQNKELPFGQKLALERLVNDTAKAGKTSIVLVIEHEVHNTSEIIDVGNCYVRNYFFNDSWNTPNEKITAGNAVKAFLANI